MANRCLLLLGVAVAVLAAVSAQNNRQEIVRGTFSSAGSHHARGMPGRQVAFRGHGRPQHGGLGHRGGHGHHRGGRRRSQTGRSGLHMNHLHQALVDQGLMAGLNPAARANGQTNPSPHHQRLMEHLRSQLGGNRRTRTFRGHGHSGSDVRNVYNAHPQRTDGVAHNLRFSTLGGDRRNGGHHHHHGRGRSGSHKGRNNRRGTHMMGHHRGHSGRRGGHHRGTGPGPRYTVPL